VGISIATASFAAVLGGLALVCLPLRRLARRWLQRPRRLRLARFGLATLAIFLAMASGADAVNAYFDYVPTVGALLGRRAVDQASAVQVQARLARPQPPPLHGMVEKIAIPAVSSGFHARAAQVYLPPAWFTVPRPALPVVELLHGTPGMPEDWTRAGAADQTTDAFAVAHGGMAPIVLMVDENGGFTNDSECAGAADRYLAVDVPGWAVSNLGARNDRQGWVIAGSSEGGYCALDLALHHRDRFGSFVDLSGLDRPTHTGGALRLYRSRLALLDHTPRWLLARRLAPGPPLAGWFEVGGADHGTMRAMLEVARLAASSGIQSRVMIVPNAHHTWRVWRHAFADALPWITWRTGLSPAPPPAPARARRPVERAAARARRRRPVAGRSSPRRSRREP
jgi:enterochelin esterase-like enzyme